MKRLLARLRLAFAAWTFLQRWHRTAHGNWPVVHTDEETWTTETAAALANFLRTPSGAALILKLREADLLTTAHAVHTSTTVAREYRCGYAAGFRALVAYLHALSTPPAAHAGSEPDAKGADALLARLAP